MVGLASFPVPARLPLRGGKQDHRADVSWVTGHTFQPRCPSPGLRGCPVHRHGWGEAGGWALPGQKAWPGCSQLWSGCTWGPFPNRARSVRSVAWKPAYFASREVGARLQRRGNFEIAAAGRGCWDRVTGTAALPLTVTLFPPRPPLPLAPSQRLPALVGAMKALFHSFFLPECTPAITPYCLPTPVPILLSLHPGP